MYMLPFHQLRTEDQPLPETFFTKKTSLKPSNPSNDSFDMFSYFCSSLRIKGIDSLFIDFGEN